MKSWRFHKFGAFDSLRMEEVPLPEPDKNDCVIKIDYAALNPADRLLIMGWYPTSARPPFAVGRDGSGVVVATAEGSRFQLGDRVVCLRSIIGIERDGTLAEYVRVPEAHLALRPDWWDARDGAAGPHALLTSWQALSEVSDLRGGETVLITGASGGIGTAALILAKAMGANVVALSRSAKKRLQLIDLGADIVLDPGDDELIQKIKTNGGCDVVIVNVCGELLNSLLKTCNPYGRICIIGALGGTAATIELTRLIFKRLQIHGIQVAMYSDSGLQSAWSDVIQTIEPIQAKIPIDSIFSFEQVPQAFDRLRQGPFGKVLIGPMSSD